MLQGKGNGRGDRRVLVQGSNPSLQQQYQGSISNTDKLEDLTIVSFNVGGLNSPYKRSKILDFLRRKKIDIAQLQETHLKPNDVSRVQNRFYKPVVSSADGTRTKGVMILMRRGINVSIEKFGSDN